MNNFNKLIDYINILHAKINLLLSDGGNISVLASILSHGSLRGGSASTSYNKNFRFRYSVT